MIRSVPLCVLLLSGFCTYPAFAESSNSTEDLFKKGIEAVRLNQYQDAISYFDEVLKINPDHLGALNTKGALLGKLGQYKDAIQYFDKVLSIEPNNLDALSNKGAALIKLGQYKDALTYINKVLEIDENNVGAINNKKIASKEVGFIPVKNSKFSVFVQIEVRNSLGQLVGYTESDNIFYVDYTITEKFLDSEPVARKITRDGQSFDLLEIVRSETINNDAFFGESKITSKFFDDVVVFSAFHPGLTIEKGDTIYALWTIIHPSH